MLEILDRLRREKSATLDRDRRSQLGQFMTPYPVARFMASLFTLRNTGSPTLLDAGAGLGALSSAFLQQLKTQNLDTSELQIEAFEIDDEFRGEIEKLFACMAATDSFVYRIEDIDFIEEAAHRILFGQRECFDYAILNPPYKKINSDSRHRSLLRSVGIETVNLYSAFVSLAIKLLKPNGQLVAIIPRSFCNGPYYKSFREQLFRGTGIRHIHLFEARNRAFKDDDVLQENVIIAVEKGAKQGHVTVTTSTDGSFSDLKTHAFPFERIKYPDDPESFLHIPTSDEPDFHEASDAFQHLLPQLLLEVSTGPVVDFRVREHTTRVPGEESVPLLYPGHFEGSNLMWPRTDWKKPNAIAINQETMRWLYPAGFYTLVRRFSSKEEKRRIRACVFDPERLPEFDLIGFENHFNVFHFRKEGLDRDVAYGLSVFLNSTAVDKYFRRMNGHTQVNATDLRRLRYPSRSALSVLGRLVQGVDPTDQQIADSILKLSSTSMHKNVADAVKILTLLGIPPTKVGEQTALCLLAVLNMQPRKKWKDAEAPLIGITPIIEWIAKHYGKRYAPNTRETIRKSAMHVFVSAGLVQENPDKPDRPVNSPNWVYQVSSAALDLIRTFGTRDWDFLLKQYLIEHPTLVERYSKERDLIRIPIRLAEDIQFSLPRELTVI